MRSLSFRILEILISYGKPMPYKELQLAYSVLYGNNYSSKYSIRIHLYETLTRMVNNQLVDYIGKKLRTYRPTQEGLNYYFEEKNKLAEQLMGVIK